MSYDRMLENIDAQRYGTTEELKETRFIDGVLEGKTGALAAKEAGYGLATQRTPNKLIESTELRARYQQMAREKGLTIDRVGDKVSELLEARANQTLEGKQVTQSDAPDYRVQIKALELHANLMGLNDAGKASQAGSSITVSVTGAAADSLAAWFEGKNS